MPKTQQEWLERYLRLLGANTTPLPSDLYRGWAETLALAWPSSPQGLAVKQLVEKAEYAIDVLANEVGSDSEAVLQARESLGAARKAGL